MTDSRNQSTRRQGAEGRSPADEVRQFDAGGQHSVWGLIGEANAVCRGDMWRRCGREMGRGAGREGGLERQRRSKEEQCAGGQGLRSILDQPVSVTCPPKVLKLSKTGEEEQDVLVFDMESDSCISAS